MTRKREVSNAEALANPGISRCMDVLTDLLHEKAERQSIEKPHRVMTKKEYDEFACWGRHVVDLNYEGSGNVAFWFLESVTGAEFERGKDVGKAIGWQQAKDDSSKMLEAMADGKNKIEAP